MFNADETTDIDWYEMIIMATVNSLVVESCIASSTPEDAMEVVGPILQVQVEFFTIQVQGMMQFC